MTQALADTAAVTPEEAAELLARFQAERQPQFFEPLIRAHHQKVAACIYRIVQDPTLTDDLLQETFIRAYQKFDTYNGQAAFSTWVCRIGMNVAISYLRKEKKWRRSDLPEEVLPNRPQDRPDHQIQVREARQQIDQAMQELSPPLRAALVMSVVEHMAIEDIAETLGCPKATVYWRIHKARKVLKRLLAAGA